MNSRYKIGVIKSDMGGCFQYRVLQPLNEQKRYGIDYVSTPFLPQNPSEPQDDTILRWVEQFDLIIIQRCFKYDIFQRVHRACQIAGRKLVFETDDDYINLPVYNPCHVEINKDGILEGFKQILREADCITVSTQELKDVYYLYNKNIKVLPNNVEHVTMFKDQYVQPIGPDGKVPLHEIYGFVSYPTWISYEKENKLNLEKLFRVGYTATPTHRQDYLTIKPYLEKFLTKFPNTVMFYMGDPWFVNEGHPAGHKNVIHIPNLPHDLYLQNIRNFDIGIAPLVPDIFNMGKSSLKLLEYGSWGIPGLAPDYITYNRHFTHGENAMLYKNGREFYEYMCELASNHELRNKLGYNSAKLISEKHTEKANGLERFDYYQSIIEGSAKPLRFIPTPKVTNETNA